MIPACAIGLNKIRLRISLCLHWSVSAHKCIVNDMVAEQMSVPVLNNIGHVCANSKSFLQILQGRFVG
jgi:hypothetical protein